MRSVGTRMIWRGDSLREGRAKRMVWLFIACVGGTGVAMVFTWWLLNPPVELWAEVELDATRTAIRKVCTGEQQERIAKMVVDELEQRIGG